MKLNLGSRNDAEEGWMNLDIVNYPEVDIIWDLNKHPYPFKNNTIEEIKAIHIIEHLDNPKRFLQEIERILKKGGKALIITPHFSNGLLTWGELEHKRTFSTNSINECDWNFKVEKRIIFGTFYRVLGIEFLANRFSNIYEIYLAWIFPAKLLEFRLIKNERRLQ